MNHSVLISTSSFGKLDETPINQLKSNGCNITLNPYKRTMTEAEISELIQDHDFLIAGTEPLTESVLKQAKKLKGISRCGIGMNNVDSTAADKLGILLANTPDAPTMAVAELTLGLILNVLRKVSHMNSELKQGHWNKAFGTLLTGKVIGLIGFGRIGQAVAQLLTPFNVTILAYDPFIEKTQQIVQFVDLQQLLQEAHIISAHTGSDEPLITKENAHLIKNGAYFFNTSRAHIMDESILFEKLSNGEITGAGIDVFSKEPYSGPLTACKNAVLTPHIGSYAKESRIEQECQSANNIIKWIND